jgi:hypothetical protein
MSALNRQGRDRHHLHEPGRGERGSPILCNRQRVGAAFRSFILVWWLLAMARRKMVFVA